MPQLWSLVPANPWQELFWEAFQALPNLAKHYEFQPTGCTWHLFTDGTRNAFDDPDTPLAAWSVVWAEHGTISCGYLPGIQQTIFRAATMAVLIALGWVQQREGVLHLWVDSQSVLDCLRELLVEPVMCQSSNIRIYGRRSRLFCKLCGRKLCHTKWSATYTPLRMPRSPGGMD